MRTIRTHHTNDCNRALTIHAHEPAAGGASVRYDILGFNTRFNPGRRGDDGCDVHFQSTAIVFQNGPAHNGNNGITNEALLAIVIDRLKGFQNGPYKCRENELVLSNLEDAMQWLTHRTLARALRGVEGTHTV